MAWTRITMETGKMGGRPCIRGLRIPVGTVLRCISGGMSVEQILDAYPELEAPDVAESLEFAEAAVSELRTLPSRRRAR